jgi:iron complex transport system ATP-binding protein
LLLAHGKIVAAGPLAEALTSESLTETFGIPIDLSEAEGRFSARAA